MNKLQTVRDALKYGVLRLNMHGDAVQVMPLHDAIAIVDELMAQEPIGKLVINKHSDAGIGIEFSIQNPEEVLFVNQSIYAAPKGT